MSRKAWHPWERELGDHAEAGDLAAVHALLAAADQPMRPRALATALARSAHHGRIEVVEALLAAGAGPNVLEQGRLGRTPLLAAAQQRRIEVMKRLLAAGAHPSQRSFAGTTPMQQAIVDGSEDVVALLVEHDAAVYIPDEQDMTEQQIALDRVAIWQSNDPTSRAYRLKSAWRRPNAASGSVR
jgi:ankyrin repeat protein